MGNLTAWFEKMSKLPFVARNAGYVKVPGKSSSQGAEPAGKKQSGGKQGQPQKKEAPKFEAKKEEAEDDDFDPFADDGEDEEATKEALQKKAKDAAAKKKKAPPTAKSLLIFEVKPWGPETDLDALGKKICAEVTMDGLTWKTEFKKEPVAFGVFKIVIGCVIEDEKVSVDDIQEKIEGFEDDVQSVDIAAFNKL